MSDYTLQILLLTWIIILGFVIQIKILKEIRKNTSVSHIMISKTVTEESVNLMTEDDKED